MIKYAMEKNLCSKVTNDIPHSFRLKKMFATGTQKRHWMFTGVTEIDQLRVESVERYVNLYGKNMQVSLYPTQNYYLNTF